MTAAQQSIAEMLHRNRSIHTHKLHERQDNRSCGYCDLDAKYALRALREAGYVIQATEELPG